MPARTGDKQNPRHQCSNLEDNFALAFYAGGDKSPRVLAWDVVTKPLYAGLDAAD